MDIKDKKLYLEEHFLYEFEMLFFVFRCLNEGQHKQSMQNMLLECFGLHMRNLMGFFYNDKKHDSDSVASDFVGGRWKEKRPKKTDVLKDAVGRANVELAHMTYRRISGTPPEKVWDCQKIFLELLKVTKAFINNLPKIYFEGSLSKLKEEVNNL